MTSTVAILHTQPESVLADYHRLMNLAGYRSVLEPGLETALKVNISWHDFYPACSQHAVAVGGCYPCDVG